jgi:ferredoxin
MLELDEKLCGECGGCVAVCPVGALQLFSNGLLIKQDLCTLCGNCVIFCPVGALTIETIHPKTPFYSQARKSDPDNER